MTADSIDIQQGRHAMQLAREEWGDRPLRPIGPQIAELVELERQQCTVIGEWFAISVEVRQEQLAKGELAKCGFIPYLPVVWRKERHGRGAMRNVRRSMFVNYMFVKCEPVAEHWQKVATTRGVRRILGQDRRPKAIEEGKMEVIRFVEADSLKAELDRAIEEASAEIAKAGGKSGIVWHFTAGDRVRIKNGPFAGFYAELQTAVDSRDRIRADISLLGGNPLVELSAFDIEAL
jgi:transcription antitermination factor NusG